MKISVIIPVYNVEKYLSTCINSVLCQTYSDLEIILVDDGSTDSCGTMCDEYAGYDSRIITVHKENGGLSSARNYGLEIATGDSIFFLDSDDYVPADCLNTCANIMEKYDADLVILKMMYVPEAVNEPLVDHEHYFELRMNAEQAIEQSLYQHFFACSATTRLFKRNVIGNLRFPEGKLSEDLATCHLFFSNASTIVYANKVGLYYRQQSKSIMHSFNNKRLDALEWAHQVELYCLQYYPGIIKAAYTRTFNVAVHLLLDINYSDVKYSQYMTILRAEIRRTRWSVILNQKSRKRDKIAAILSFLGDRILKLIWESKISSKVKQDAFPSVSIKTA